MKKVFLNLLFLVVGLHVFSQVRTAYDFENFAPYGVVNSFADLNKELTYDDVQGSPYLDREFVPGLIILPNGSSFKDVPLRYNIYTDNMEFNTQKRGVMEIVEPSRYEWFKIGENDFKYLMYAVGNRTENGFFQVLADGDAMLLKKHRVSFRAAEPVKAFKDPVPPQFVLMSPDMYLSVNGQPAEKAANAKKTMELLEQVKPGISSWVKSEKLKLNKEEDLLKAVQYCNQ